MCGWSGRKRGPRGDIEGLSDGLHLRKDFSLLLLNIQLNLFTGDPLQSLFVQLICNPLFCPLDFSYLVDEGVVVVADCQGVQSLI